MTKPKPMTDFERTAYLYLREHGWDAFADRYPVHESNKLIDRWTETGKIRVRYERGGVIVQTFKKYAQ